MCDKEIECDTLQYSLRCSVCGYTSHNNGGREGERKREERDQTSVRSSVWWQCMQCPSPCVLLCDTCGERIIFAINDPSSSSSQHTMNLPSLPPFHPPSHHWVRLSSSFSSHDRMDMSVLFPSLCQHLHSISTSHASRSSPKTACSAPSGSLPTQDEMEVSERKKHDTSMECVCDRERKCEW